MLGPHRGGLFLHRVGPVQWSTQVRVDPVRRKRARYSVHTARMYLPPWRESMFPRFLSSICNPLAKVSSTPLAQPRRVRFEILSATFVNIGMRMTFKHTKHFSTFASDWTTYTRRGLNPRPSAWDETRPLSEAAPLNVKWVPVPHAI